MESRNQAKHNSWRVGLFPGLSIICLAILLRVFGGLQIYEWLMLDRFLQSRTTEPRDERITIIGIDEPDIERKGYPIPDADIANLLTTIQQYQPAAVGLDLAKNLAEPELIAALTADPDQYAVAKIFPPQVPPPPEIPETQVGFVDVSTDDDSRLRRIILGGYCDECETYQKSLTLKLAESYFKQRGITLENSDRDPQAMAFDNVELPLFYPYTGGYINTVDNGQQMLLNYRINQDREPFRMISLADVEQQNFDPSWLQGRIILIGMTAPSVPDMQNTTVAGSKELSAGKIYGVEVIAHSVSQILSAVEDGRPLIRTLPEPVEYLWIIVWGVVGMGIAWLPARPWKNLLAIGITNLGLSGFCWLLLAYTGWWLPVVPATMVCLLNGFALTPFYYRDRSLKALLVERQKTIDLTYDSIHNGPLQTLKLLIRNTRDGQTTQAHSLHQLETLDQEMREVYESLYQQTSNPVSSDRAITGTTLDMQQSLHKLLEQVYRNTTERMANQKFPHFASLRVLIPDFQPVADRDLTSEQKLGICRILEEALCNVGNHAQGATRLKVKCYQQADCSILQIEDNGAGCNSTKEGRGTKQAQKLAQKLGGKFERTARGTKPGTLCQLTWQNKQNPWTSLLAKLPRLRQNLADRGSQTSQPNHQPNLSAKTANKKN